MKKEAVKKQFRKHVTQIQLMYLLSTLVSVATIALLLWFGVLLLFRQMAQREAPPISEEGTEAFVEKSCEYERVLDGVCVDGEDNIYPRLVAVMIENHTDARPQSGLSDASVVYEAPVEANYSRFLAIYPEDTDVSKAGPVRSARPYYLDWLEEYGNPMYMHVGGSPDALARIYNEGVFDINEMGRGWYFWRSTDRYAPHNTYTSEELWSLAFENYWQETYDTEFQGWSFGASDVCDPAEENDSDPCVEEITILFLPPSYEAVWKFDRESGRYERYQLGRPHTDQNGNKIAADTIVVQKVKTQVVDEVGRLAMETTGGGEAVVFQGGRKIDAQWKKETRTARTIWLDKDGNEIDLNPGTIWIEVVNGRGSVSWE